MMTAHRGLSSGPSSAGIPPVPGWHRPVEWLVGIAGAIAVLYGLLILFAGDDQYIGVIDWTWRIGDIDVVWGYGLLGAGIVVLAAVVAMVVRDRRRHR